jgi:hypothetical protein
MKAIETEYSRVLFRSRLEARWAIFFDAFGLKWVYEPECFLLSNGQKYTPDFYIVDFKLYIEIKPNFDWMLDDYHKKRYEIFEKPLLVLSQEYPSFSVNLLYNHFECESAEVVFIPKHYKYGDFFFSGYGIGSEEDDFNDEYKSELDKVKKYRFYL